MTNERHDHGGVSHAQKERGATPSETTPHGTTDPADCTSTTPRPRKRAERPGSGPAGHTFDDLPGAGDLDWTGA